MLMDRVFGGGRVGESVIIRLVGGSKVRAVFEAVERF